MKEKSGIKPLISLSDKELELLKKRPKKITDEDGDDERFIDKDEKQKEEQKESLEELKESEEIKALINKIFPKNNQQRNLDRETGGLEAKEQKEISAKDIWDDRSEEVDKMGSTDTFNTTGMKSVVWKQKRDRLAKKKLAKKHQESSVDTTENGYVSRLKNLRLDRSEAYNKNSGNSR